MSKERTEYHNKNSVSPTHICPTLHVYADRPTRFGSGQIADGESEREGGRGKDGWMDGWMKR